MDPAPPSWFPTTEELDAYAYRRREERGWAPHWFRPPPGTVLDPVSVIVCVEEGGVFEANS
jgi:hypothetical protein